MSEIEDRWLIYALGGGCGHLTRAVALARAALRKSNRRSVVVLTNSAMADSLPIQMDLGPRGRLVVLDCQMSKDELSRRVAQLLELAEFDVLLVDTFPRGLVGELVSVIPQLDCTKVLVHRDINPSYVRAYNLRRTIERYDLVLIPGEDAPFQDRCFSQRTSPWLVRDHDELLSTSAANQRLQVSDCQLPTIAVVGCGRAEEQDEYWLLAHRLTKKLVGQANVRLVTPRMIEALDQPSPHLIRAWPFLELLPAVDLVVGAGGYNTVNESRATGTPLVALGRARMYDRQKRRLRPYERAVDIDDVQRRVIAFAQNGTPRREPSNLIPYTNGVHQAVNAIESFSAR